MADHWAAASNSDPCTASRMPNRDLVAQINTRVPVPYSARSDCIVLWFGLALATRIVLGTFSLLLGL